MIFDPVQSYFVDDKDSHKATEVRPRMDALISLAKRHNIGVLLIRHLSKSSGGRAIHRGMGSIDFTGAARIELMVGSPPNRHQERAIVPVKNNLGPSADSLQFKIERPGRGGKIIWLGKSPLTAADLTAPDSAGRPKKSGQAVQFLREQLQNEPKTKDELVKLGEIERLNKKALERAMIEAGVRSERRGAATAIWSLWKLDKGKRKYQT